MPFVPVLSAAEKYLLLLVKVSAGENPLSELLFPALSDPLHPYFLRRSEKNRGCELFRDFFPEIPVTRRENEAPADPKVPEKKLGAFFAGAAFFIRIPGRRIPVIRPFLLREIIIFRVFMTASERHREELSEGALPGPVQSAYNDVFIHSHEPFIILLISGQSF